MDLSDGLLIAGAGTILAAFVGPRVFSKLAEKKRWIIIAGILLLAGGTILDWQDIQRAFQEGFSSVGH